MARRKPRSGRVRPSQSNCRKQLPYRAWAPTGNPSPTTWGSPFLGASVLTEPEIRLRIGTMKPGRRSRTRIFGEVEAGKRFPPLKHGASRAGKCSLRFLLGESQAGICYPASKLGESIAGSCSAASNPGGMESRTSSPTLILRERKRGIHPRRRSATGVLAGAKNNFFQPHAPRAQSTS